MKDPNYKELYAKEVEKVRRIKEMLKLVLKHINKIEKEEKGGNKKSKGKA